jgi:putative endonuclease
MALDARKTDRLSRYRSGRFSEIVGAAALMAKGYRILARRCRTPYGEIDLIACRGKSLIFVEVKRRPTRLDGEAALSQQQARRIARAAEHWVHQNPSFRDHETRIDALLIVPGRLPRHLPGALNVTLAGLR